MEEKTVVSHVFGIFVNEGNCSNYSTCAYSIYQAHLTKVTFCKYSCVYKHKYIPVHVIVGGITWRRYGY